MYYSQHHICVFAARWRAESAFLKGVSYTLRKQSKYREDGKSVGLDDTRAMANLEVMQGDNDAKLTYETHTEFQIFLSKNANIARKFLSLQ